MKTLDRVLLACVVFALPPSVVFAAPLFPEIEGTEWHYATESVPVQDPYAPPIIGTYEIKITRIQRSGDTTHFTIREYDNLSGRYRFSVWEISSNTVKIRDIDFPGPLSRDADGFRFEFLRFPFVPGQKYDDGQWLTEVKTQEEILVPGISTPQTAWKISVIGTRNQDYTAVGNYWIVPNWGIVKSTLNARGWFLDSQVTERKISVQLQREHST